MGLFKKCKGVNPNYTDAMMILHSDNKILVNRNDKLDHELDCARFSIQILEYKLKKLEDSKKVDAAKSVNKLTEADSVICNLKKKVAWLENQLAEKEPKPKNEIISTGREITIRIPCEKNKDPNFFEEAVKQSGTNKTVFTICDTDGNIHTFDGVNVFNCKDVVEVKGANSNVIARFNGFKWYKNEM